MISLYPPEKKVTTTIKIGGSKSLSNRYLILNRVLNFNLSFENLSDSEDTVLLQQALKNIAEGQGGTIDVGHAGTDFRFLTALLSLIEGEWVLTGSARMKKRPIGGLVDALQALGAEISYIESDNFPPLKIKGKKLHGGLVEVDGSISSQFISALLLIGPVLEEGLTITFKGEVVSRPYIDMTIAALQTYGLEVISGKSVVTVKKLNTSLQAAIIQIESDWSSASYWYSICALQKNSEFILSSFKKDSCQADSILPEIFRDLGVATFFENGNIRIKNTGTHRSQFSYDFIYCPDIAQTVAVVCVALKIEAKLTGLSTLKNKETDRIVALQNELSKLGATITAFPDALHIEPPQKLSTNQITISTYNDHRMAMSFAPLSILIPGMIIDDETIVSKSYPGFWNDLISVGFNVNLRPL